METLHYLRRPALRRPAFDWETVEVAAAEVPTAGRDFLFGSGPEPHVKWKTFCAVLLQLARDAGVEEIVSLGGYLAEILYSRPAPVTGFASDAQLLQRSTSVARTTRSPPASSVSSPAPVAPPAWRT